MLITLDIIAAVFILVLIFTRYRQVRRLRKLPPGPPATFFGLGDHRNLINTIDGWLWNTYMQWADRYGPIFSYRLGGTTVIVLNSAKLAWDLLEKRGDIYSSRPRQIMASELASGSMRGGMAPYGLWWRKWRKVQHLGMSNRQAMTYRPFQTFESSLVLRSFVNDPEAYVSHLQRFALSVVFSISYGSRVKSLRDQLVDDNSTAIQNFVRYMMPGVYLVESYPILLRLPRCLQWFRREPDRLKASSEELYVRLLSDVEEKMHKGTARESASRRVLSSGNNMGLSKVEMAWAVSAPFSAGVSSTTASLVVFTLAMLHYPDVARKAHKELDDVVGREQMPTFDYEKSLPYITALVKEVTRWRAIVPMGLPHAVVEDDYHDGFLIPKGATIHPHIYAMTRDPDMFPDPDVFRPERFLDATDPRLIEFTLPFGFGRRICAAVTGYAEATDLVARILWAFDIQPALDQDEKPVLPHPDAFEGQFAREPVPFPCRFVPRHAEVEKIIEMEAADADIQLKAWE